MTDERPKVPLGEKRPPLSSEIEFYRNRFLVALRKDGEHERFEQMRDLPDEFWRRKWSQRQDMLDREEHGDTDRFAQYNRGVLE